MKNGQEPLPHTQESLALSIDTLRRYPADRVMHPVMNSIRPEIEMNPFVDRGNAKQALKPVPIDQRPLDNEYAWKGNPYQVDGWLKPSVTSLQFACDDSQVVWFSDAGGAGVDDSRWDEDVDGCWSRIGRREGAEAGGIADADVRGVGGDGSRRDGDARWWDVVAGLVG